MHGETHQAKSFYAGKTRGFEFMGEVPPSLRPMLGASLCGVVASKYPGVLFFGYDIVNGILKESSPFVGDVSTLLTLLFLKSRALFRFTSKTLVFLTARDWPRSRRRRLKSQDVVICCI